MLTSDQAREYLATVGVNVPDFILTALVAQVNSIEACLIGAGYPEGSGMLIQMYLLGLLGLSQGDRYISSQTAPSGASQSFRFQTVNQRYNGLLGLLRNLDLSGCADHLIPPNPEGTKRARWIVGRACR